MKEYLSRDGSDDSISNLTETVLKFENEVWVVYHPHTAHHPEVRKRGLGCISGPPQKKTVWVEDTFVFARRHSEKTKLFCLKSMFVMVGRLFCPD